MELVAKVDVEPAQSIAGVLCARIASLKKKKLYSWFDDDPPGSISLKIELTYEQVLTRAHKIAIQLENVQTEESPVLLVFEPGLLFICAFFGCGLAGKIAVPCYPPDPRRRGRAEVHAFVSIQAGCGAKVALTSSAYNWAKKTADLALLDLRGKRWPQELKWIIATSDEDKEKSIIQHISLPTNQIAFLQYTSGSTSDPKGVIVTQKSLLHNLNLIIRELNADSNTIVVSWLPMYHDMGLIGSYLGACYCGGSGFYTSPFNFVKRPQIWLEALSQFKGTHTQAPNFAFALTVRKFQQNNQLNLSSIRHIINGAEPVEAQAMDQFIKTFEPLGLNSNVLFPTYGLAESTVMVTTNGRARLCIDVEALVEEKRVVKADHGPQIMGCGKPVPEMIIRIVRETSDQQFQDVTDRGLVGEIWVCSESVSAGYWGLDELTQATFGAILANEETARKFLRTGDEGFIHEDELFVCGRIKDLIILRGKNYYPQDLERTVERAATSELRPGCTACFEQEELCVLVAEVRENNKRSLNELAPEIASAVAAEHAIDVGRIVFIKARTIPKTTSGKIARRRCKSDLAANRLSILHDYHTKSLGAPILQSTHRNSDGGNRSTVGHLTDVPLDDEEERQLLDPSTLEHQLASDLAELSGIRINSIRRDAPLATFLGSLETAQFAAILEQKYKCPKIPEDLLHRDELSLLSVTKLVELFGYGKSTVFEEEAFQRAINSSSQLKSSSADQITGKRQNDSNFFVENCPCLLLCCPKLIRKKKK
mmetsp:Transcript_18124/g.23620  ORF Transcript_18124/g.23620 Transcript_18124/m.23620 type:complete len:766 (+) Transcript_18124:47-2344(+)